MCECMYLRGGGYLWSKVPAGWGGMSVGGGLAIEGVLMEGIQERGWYARDGYARVGRYHGEGWVFRSRVGVPRLGVGMHHWIGILNELSCCDCVYV